jgi:hypothetical protein
MRGFDAASGAAEHVELSRCVETGRTDFCRMLWLVAFRHSVPSAPLQHRRTRNQPVGATFTDIETLRWA